MDTDVIAHGNLDFSPTHIETNVLGEEGEEVGTETLISDGVRMVAVYVVHKKTLNNAERWIIQDEIYD